VKNDQGVEEVVSHVTAAWENATQTNIQTGG
jgi:hypothetical protein